MKIIILAGGNGKRLWPLSSDIMPKQYMKVVKNDKGESCSMVQKTWSILAQKYGESNLYVVGGESQALVLAEQLGPTAQLILEPSRRDTFPAIALASVYLSDIGTSADETVVVIPVDAHADGDYYDLLGRLDESIQRGEANLGLVGIRPSEVSEKYGYILSDPVPGCAARRVNRFVEKPELAAAAALIEKDALWNGGIFAFRLAYILGVLTGMNRPLQYAKLKSRYDTMPRISFDYMVTETEKNMICVRYEGEWTDLGTWKDIVRVLGENDTRNFIKDDRSAGTFVINQLNVPIVVAGISNAVVVASPEGILICDRSVSHQIKPLIEQIRIKDAVDW
ncbi:sugar phosphate nucleotidyltransferase [Cohnella panacarvi]|uniref:sugar phosphate nucleotidyltransferase n=1 Tax=Cohnella panacarvi TaxID=400776 RepID=UPI000479668C|nr:sugar phosphate nucleotidyltransferase [Cohnella panacarvi]